MIAQHAQGPGFNLNSIRKQNTVAEAVIVLTCTLEAEAGAGAGAEAGAGAGAEIGAGAGAECLSVESRRGHVINQASYRQLRTTGSGAGGQT